MVPAVERTPLVAWLLLTLFIIMLLCGCVGYVKCGVFGLSWVLKFLNVRGCLPTL